MIWGNVLFVARLTYILRMKKKIAIVLAIVAIIASAAALTACNRRQDTAAPSDISRITESYYAGESDLFAVSVESGRREKMFIADGKVTDVVPFTELKIIPLKSGNIDSINFVLSAGEDALSGTLTDSSHGEFKDLISLDFIPEKISVTAGEQTSEIELCNVLEGAITSEQALDIAREAFKDKLEAEKADGITREVYIKLITGDRENYYYYVSFIGNGVNYIAALISPQGEIASKRS